MYNKVIFLATCFAVIQGSETHHCASPQYARYNEKFIFECDIQPGVKGVYWYENAQQKDPFIKFENNEITGRGYDSGEYNILSSGALVINDVTWKHSGTFKVLVLDQLLSIDNSFVRLEVIVEPHQVAPAIDVCKRRTYCSLYVEDYESLQCAVQGARPALQLQWFLTQADGEDILQFDSYSIPTDEGTYNSSSSIIFDQRILSLLPSVFTCIASGPALALSTKPSQSSVLLESAQSYEAFEFTETPIEKVYVEKDNPARFPCKTVSHGSLVIWRAGASQHTLQTIGYSFLGSDAEVPVNHVISGDGTLLLHNVSMSYERLYVCLVKKLDLTLGVAYRLVVLVSPSPSFPVISDCFSLICNRTVPWEGTLSCKVYNVHPDVDLFLLTKSSITRLGNQSRQKTVDEKSKLSTISVHATYSIADALCGENIPITCQASGPASVVFNSTAKIRITKRDCNFVVASTRNMAVIWIVVPVGLLMLIACGCTLCYFKISKGKKLVPSPTITTWQTRSYFLQFPLTQEDVRMICNEGNLQRLCRMYEMNPAYERKIMERKDDPATAFLEALYNNHGLCSKENVEKIKTEELSIKNMAKTYGGQPESITGFTLQGWTVDDITSLSTSNIAVSYHHPEKTCSMILIGNETQVHWYKHFQSSRVNAFRFLCALEDDKLISCCESSVVKLQSYHSLEMIDTEHDLKERMEKDTQRLWGISYNRSSKKVAIGVEGDNKIFLFDAEMNFSEEIRVEKTNFWPQHFALTSYIGNEYITLCTWPQNNVMCYNPKIKSSVDFNQIEGTLWAKHICCGTDGLVYVLFSETPKRGEKLPYILQYKVTGVNPISKLENLHEDTCVITYADSGACHEILTMDRNGNIKRFSSPPTDEKTWKESKWKKLSTKKDPNPSFKEEEETLLQQRN